MRRAARMPVESSSYIVVAARSASFSDSSMIGYTMYPCRPFSTSPSTNRRTRSRAEAGRSTVVTGWRPGGRSSSRLTSRSP